YFDLLSEPPGRVARTQAELERLLADRGYDDTASRQALSAFQAKFCEFDDGHAAERVVRRLFLGEGLPDRFDELRGSEGTLGKS
ncbi:MAG: CDP-glycerol glycerophosphotransferase family protein, partial [Acidimicrobiales bacterium]